MVSKKDADFSLSDMVKTLSQGIRKKQLSIHNYDPHDKQLEFHTATNRGRMFLGGNRSGKTVGGAVEAIWWVTRKHPYYRLPDTQIEGRCGSVDFINGVDKITLPEVRKWLPASELINGSWEDSWSNQYRTLTLANGNYLEFLSYDQDLDKWAGTARDFVWFDEEPPQAIFEEAFTRLVSKNGRWWMTMTPVEGATWTLDELYERSVNRGAGLLKPKDIYVVEVEVEDNRHLDMNVVNEIFGEMSDEQQMIRRRGKYRHDTEIIFNHFDKDRNIFDKMPFDPRRNPFRVIASVDLGMNAPTAWLWHALTPEGDVYTFHEIVKAELTIPEFAEEVKAYEKKYGIRPAFRVGDPAAKQRSRQTGLSDWVAYAQHGLNFALGNNDYSGLDKMNDYLRTGKWKIAANCGTLIKEMRRYRWEPWADKKMKAKNNPKDKPKKKDDHAIDSTRYMFSFLPDLSQEPEGITQARINDINRKMREEMGTKQGYNPAEMIDYDLQFQRRQETQWAYDPNVGEF